MRRLINILCLVLCCAMSVQAQLVPSLRKEREAERLATAERRAAMERAAQSMRAASDTTKTTTTTTTATAGEELTVDTVAKVPLDSALMAPLQVQQLGAENYDDLTSPKSSMDLTTPDNIKTVVEYDAATGRYVAHTRVGDVDVTTPYLMSEQEYKSYSERQLMHSYWQQKIGEVEHNNEKKFDITDMKFNIGPADKVFGPGGVQIKMQGSAELLFGFKHQFIDNPSLTQRARNNNIFDFDQKIQASINGKVGDKLNFTMNYNTEASFSFDQQNLKLAYKGQEDDIIQSIEAGNVTMDLNSNLIRGSQALFGVKTNLQFGKLKIQALVSQQNSEAQTVSSQGGAQMTKYEIDMDQYDENRHFFLSYFFRDKYEEAMKSLPYVASGVTINKIEVWVTNKRGNFDQARNIVALVDLGETGTHLMNSSWGGTTVAPPDNSANALYQDLLTLSEIRNIQSISTLLDGYHGMEGGEDFEKVESARLLTSSDYTLNAALGYITLKSALQQDEVLAVAYEFTYGGKVFQVGEFSTDGGEELKAPATLILKMLKSGGNAPCPKGKGKGTWDLMMKNIYSLGATSISQEKFELYVNYRNDSIGTNMQYLSEGAIRGKQLIRVLGLDRLDSRNNPSPDGKFDYVEGLTVQSSGGRIIFPVLEPFGSFLASQIGDAKIAQRYVFQELYDSTLVVAQEMSEKKKFTLSGRYKGTSGSEIRLGAMNVPRGSVTVTAGGATLIENVDYTVDYTMGTVTILNQSILESGTNVDVKLENQSTFSMQRKSLVGAHLEYQFTKDLVLGGTIMHMTERPLTTKVNMGSEPLSNTIWGVNGSWKTEMQWLSNVIDRIPWITATQPSTFQINAEFAHLIPGHTRDVGAVGTAYVDDFENTATGIDVHYPNYWFLSSTPQPFEEHSLSNNIEYGKNRALLAWYVVDPIFGYPQTNTPTHIRNNADAMSDHRTRIVYEQELYPNKEVVANADTRLAVLNLSFYPEERGPYNIFYDGSQYTNEGKLSNPTKRWGGIMRKLDNTDFERANIEYIEFWLMDPGYTNSNDPLTPTSDYKGKLYINLGDISEDILRDGKKSFEHGLPISDLDQNRVDTTAWGLVPRTNSTVVAFSNEAGARAKQDVGLNGLSTEQEFAFSYKGRRPYQDYVDNLKSQFAGTAVLNTWQADQFSPINDPAGDNFHYYRGSDYDAQEVPTLLRYKHFNGTEGNSPATENQSETYGTASTLMPDIEDINNDNTLNEYEKYYEYVVDLDPMKMRVGEQHIANELKSRVALRNGQTVEVRWLQFKIPLHGDDARRVGSIRNFKNIRFMRMYLTDCEKEMYLRFGSLELVRGEWRQYSKPLNDKNESTPATLDVQAVNIEENSSRSPVNYVLPPGVSRQTDPGQAQLIAQNEASMVMKVLNLPSHDARAVYKNTSYDMRNYKKLQMFVHAENLSTGGAGYDPTQEVQDGELSCFIRMGSDLKYNYYEYEIPLSITLAGSYNNDNELDRRRVWPDANMFDFPLKALTDAKMARNKAKRSGNTDVGFGIPYVVYDDENNKPQNKITVMGNPTLEEIETIMIGVRNTGTHISSAEVWVNELRLSEFNEQGGVAAMANASLSVSDIAQLNVAGRLETAGYGSIESNVLDRNMENIYQLSVSAAMEVGRLFPEKAKLQIPAYVSYTNETRSPNYDPLDTDIKLKDNLETFETKAEKDSVRTMSNSVVESTNFSVTNLKVNIHSKKRDMFYDPANFSISAAYSKQNEHTPEMEKNLTTDQKGSFNYSYNFNPKPWEPFAKVEKLEKMKFFKEMNFYYLPQSWAFSTNMHRTFSHMKMRELTMDAGSDMDLTYSKDFTWDRNFDFKYDLTKNMKFSFQTAMNSTVDEGEYTKEILDAYRFSNQEYEAWKYTIQKSLAKWGSPYTYQQVFAASWNVPFNRIPYLEALTANASYNATYNWSRTAMSSSTANLGNTISSLQSWQVDGGLNLETLYGKSKYWKQMTQRYTGRRSTRPFKPKTYSETIKAVKGETVEITHRLGSETVQVTAADSLGHKIAVAFAANGTTKVNVTPKADCEALVITVTTKDPNQRTPAQVAGDMFAYVGTMIRRVQVTYRETNSLTVPGFQPEAGFMGQRRIDGFYAPGFDFAFGFVPSGFLESAQKRGWLSGDTTVVQPAARAQTSDFDIKLTLEPLPGLKIQLSGKRYMANSTSIIYSYGTMQENMSGSFNITQVALATAFHRIGSQEDNFSSETFNRFLENRQVLQGRVQAQYEGVYYPTTGFMQGKLPGGKPYDKSKGAVATNSADVLVPAFLAAYTGRDASRVSLNPFLGILSILPNWNVTYDGLSKLPGIRDHFRSFTLTHAYTCKYTIGSYNSYSTWLPAGDPNNKMVGFVRDVTTDLPIPSSAYDITNVNISEAFSPLVGVNMTLKNSLNLKTEYRKQRNMTLNVASVQLTEGHTDEFVLGGGYTIKNLNFVTKNKNGAQKKVSNDLKINVDVSYKNIKTLLRKVEENITQASNGNKVWGLKLSADYVLSQKINLQLFYDHQSTIPLISSSYPVKADNVGINIKLMLTR